MLYRDELSANFDRCIEIATNLDLCFDEERSHLIGLRMEDLSETTLRKAALIRDLVQARHGLKEKLDLLRSSLDEADRAVVQKKEREWDRIWSRTKFSAESNQRLLNNSLRNLGTLSENLRRLLGEKSRYSKQGKRVDAPSTGKVISGKTA